LCQGQALILLDGLDEVRDADNSRVLRQIRDFSQQFPQNQFVITCRIAAREYTFEQFTEVEIADFDDEQIADFASKWFRSKNDPIKAERFLQKLKGDAPIRELATNPLLLTLLCLVFEDSGSFPINRAELYQMGVDVLLKKWKELEIILAAKASKAEFINWLRK
jgi:predicted NACHT family NTPase